ncbi:unnamed protein product [Heterobilharzia americana]|nr:unnamed protein product [Heterobilharzia americana]
MHGIVGGMTSIVTQPYRGAKEDHLKGFVYGIGRGLLGTVTKPVGGILDLVSGMMSSISEAACPSNLHRPRRCRPRRAGLSKHFFQPLTVYNLDEAVAQLQMHYISLFTTVKRYSLQKYSYASSLNVILNPITKSFEIDDEIQVNDNNKKKNDYTPNMNTVLTSNKLSSLNLSSYTISRLVQAYMLSSVIHQFHFSFNSFESILYILPVQLCGVIALITDQAIWCIRDISLKNWISSRNPINQMNSTETRIHQTHPFFFTENATLLFMLHYHRLDQVYLQMHGNINALGPTFTTATTTIPTDVTPSIPVYVVFSGDSGTSKQQLRCDYLTWGLNLTFKIRKTRLHFVQATMRINRIDMLSSSSSSISRISNVKINKLIVITMYHIFKIILLH